MSAASDFRVSKPSKWFANKGLNLSFGRHRHRSKSSSTLSSSSPNSPLATTPKGGKVRENEFRDVFRYFDGDGDGKISALELRNYFGSIGEYMSHEEARGVIVDLDTDGDDLLGLDDFVELMMKREDEDDDLRKAFEMFEQEKGSGCITPKGLQRMLNRLGDTKSYEECVAMIHVFDIDGNGVLDFQEFHQMMA